MAVEEVGGFVVSTPVPALANLPAKDFGCKECMCMYIYIYR